MKDKNVELPLYPEQKTPKTLFLMMGIVIVGMGLAVWGYLL
jgi:hypothetical protein